MIKIWAILTVTFSLVACLPIGEGFKVQTSGHSGIPKDPVDPVPNLAVTYYQDIAPILNKHCVTCHSDDPDKLAPMSFTTVENAKKFAKAIALSAASRSMPPYSVNNQGDCQEFVGYEWLKDSEIKALQQWADASAPAGDSQKPAPAPIPDLPTLQQIDATVGLGTPYSPAPAAGEFDEYRCFVVEAPSPGTDRYLVGYNVIAGNSAIVHHVLLGVPATEADVTKAVNLSNSQSGGGYKCFGGFQVAASTVGAWAPGTGAVNYPGGVGIKIPAGRKMILQIHYNLLNGSGSDQTRVQLDLQDQVQRVGSFLFLGNAGGQGGSIPAGQKAYEYGIDLPQPAGNITVWSILPHMHAFGRKQKLDLTIKSQKKCGMEIPQWNYNWQFAYSYKTPLKLTRGDSARLTCTFNSEGETQPIQFGENTTEEMCIVGILATNE